MVLLRYVFLRYLVSSSRIISFHFFIYAYLHFVYAHFPDLSQGIVVCRSCGTLQVDRLVDESPEWVNHEGKADMNRASGGALDSTKGRLFGVDAPKSKKRRRGLAPDDLEEERAKKSAVTNRVRSVCVMLDNIVRGRHLTEEVSGPTTQEILLLFGKILIFMLFFPPSLQ